MIRRYSASTTRPCIWSGAPVEDAALMAEHRFVYENTFSADKFHKYVRIP